MIRNISICACRYKQYSVAVAVAAAMSNQFALWRITLQSHFDIPQISFPVNSRTLPTLKFKVPFHHWQYTPLFITPCATVDSRYCYGGLTGGITALQHGRTSVCWHRSFCKKGVPKHNTYQNHPICVSIATVLACLACFRCKVDATALRRPRIQTIIKAFVEDVQQAFFVSHNGTMTVDNAPLYKYIHKYM